MIVHALNCWESPARLTFKGKEDKVLARPTGIIRGDDEESFQTGFHTQSK